MFYNPELFFSPFLSVLFPSFIADLFAVSFSSDYAEVTGHCSVSSISRGLFDI